MTHPPGTVQRVGPARQAAGRARLDAAMAAAEERGEHVWVLTTAHLISDDLARRLAAGEDTGALLDAESLVEIAPGCFRCEEPLSPRLFHRRCRGEPDA